MILFELGFTNVEIKSGVLFGRSKYPIRVIRLGFATIILFNSESSFFLMESMRGLMDNDDYLIKQSKAFLDLERSMVKDYDKRYESQYRGDLDRKEKSINDLKERQSRYSNDLISYRRVIENLLLNNNNRLDTDSLVDLEASFDEVRKQIEGSATERGELVE